jgi:putative Holliday junction resolvase
VLEQVEELEAAFPGVRFVRWDERLTTRLARSRTESSKRGGRKRRRGGKDRVDHLAAAAMLQEYLDRRGAVAASR